MSICVVDYGCFQLAGYAFTSNAHFRSLQDPIDTALPQGQFTLQVLGAAGLCCIKLVSV